MIKDIIAFSARNRVLVLVFALAAMAGGIYCAGNINLDAIPDLSDTQVIVYSRWDRSPDIIEDQVTYPVITSLLGLPKVKTIRGFSDFGFSYVYVIFEDGTDIYWARARVLEYLSKILPQLPEGVKTEMGPDATGVGWVYQYALVDRTGRHDLAQLRSFQDWNLRYQLQSVPGVAEVAAIGGFQKQYQVNLNPNSLAAYNISIDKVLKAVRDGNEEAGARLIEYSGAEYMIRGKGYARSVKDIEDIVVAGGGGTPVLLKSLGTVASGPEIRRGVSDLDGEGDAVGGIIIMRHGENALRVIERVKERIEQVKSSLPEGMELITVYDRSDLIKRAIATLKRQLTEEMLIVSLVILIFLWHLPSAIIPIVTIPVSVLLAFIPMYFMGISSNIMSLSGIAISIGVLVDGAIVEVENAYKKLELWQSGGRKEDFHAVRLEALQEVGPAVFFSLLVIAVAFMPIFTLVDQEGRLFKPLAYTKNLTMFVAAILAITLDPALRMMFTRMDYANFKPVWLSNAVNAVTVGKYYPEEKHPISRRLFAVYEPVCRWTLEHPKKVIGAALLLIVTTIPVYLKTGSEFMPPLNEGTILYMPTTLPGISVTEAQKLLQAQDRILKSIPEVERVFGKAGRADTSTDPAPFSMMETVAVLRPQDQWRKKDRWYSSWLPEVLQKPLRHVWHDRLSWDELITDIDSRMQFPGVSNAWTMPIKARIDMLTTGVRTPVGIKIFGADLKKIEETGLEVERLVRRVKGTRSVYAERTAGGYFLDFTLKREALARYGLTVKEAQMSLMTAIGGQNLTTTVEGRERYSVNVRYARDFRDNLDKLRRVLVTAENGVNVPLAQIADIEFRQGPAMIRDENGLLSGYVYVDIEGVDVGTYVKDAKKLVGEKLKLPAGYTLQWSGQYENMLRVRERLKFVLPLTIFLIFLLIYMNTKSAVKTSIVLLAVPFSLIGAVWLVYLLGYNMSIAVWVGMIALMGLDAETGVFMLLYLELAYEEMKKAGRMNSPEDLEEAVIRGAVKRIRPKLMTVTAAFMGLVPIMWALGAGSDVMKRIAAPMIGGLFTSFALELLVYPVIFHLWKGREWKNLKNI
ncbi:MAG: cation transporter [Elusimicrobia bacterium GWA2_56_46]|nr:MAG: cation transporter [Elusimicrobia bacterium GWA2_56_46]OGR53929.1 MAG: cation transporter [Elusimicrobia bacterium GWC2_56_31]HBW23215.1 CusA/CzcA family heavy metal efflux RND transporter [Elusimicrobiota bacterium]